ncbi:hypothetical protein INR49_015836, partial [Caranx melampygus]
FSFSPSSFFLFLSFPLFPPLPPPFTCPLFSYCLSSPPSFHLHPFFLSSVILSSPPSLIPAVSFLSSSPCPDFPSHSLHLPTFSSPSVSPLHPPFLSYFFSFVPSPLPLSSHSVTPLLSLFHSIFSLSLLSLCTLSLFSSTPYYLCLPVLSCSSVSASPFLPFLTIPSSSTTFLLSFCHLSLLLSFTSCFFFPPLFALSLLFPLLLLFSPSSCPLLSFCPSSAPLPPLRFFPSSSCRNTETESFSTFSLCWMKLTPLNSFPHSVSLYPFSSCPPHPPSPHPPLLHHLSAILTELRDVVKVFGEFPLTKPTVPGCRSPSSTWSSSTQIRLGFLTRR